MSFSTPAPSSTESPEPWRPGEYDDNAIRAHPGFAASPDAFPATSSPPGKGPPPIRAKSKAAVWVSAIHRAYGYIASRICEPLERAKLDALYEDTITAGPDFARVRRNATFGPVQVATYSPKTAREIMRQAREIEDKTYAARAKGAHGGALGRLGLQLLEWFVFKLWPKSARFGMVPSLANIATGARMSKATVVDAMKRLETFGLLGIERRRKRIATPLGAKVVQAPSAYTLSFAKGLGALALAAFGKGAQAAGEKPTQTSESTKSPAIRNEHYSPTAQPQHWFPRPDYKPLLT